MTLLDKAKAKAEHVAHDLGHEGPLEWKWSRDHQVYYASLEPVMFINATEFGRWFIDTEDENYNYITICGGKVTEEDVDRLILPAYKGTPWTTADAIGRLCSFVQSSLAGGYDGHGWEELQIAATIVHRALAAQGLCGTEQETC